MCTGYDYYAVQFHGECHCANKLWKSKYGKVSGKSCNSPCNGDVSIMCGGEWLNSVYKTNPHIGEQRYKCRVDEGTMSTAPDTSDTTVDSNPVSEHSASTPHNSVTTKAPEDSSNSYGNYVGCFRDSQEELDFSVFKGPWGDLTPTTCNALCSGYAFFGLQHGNECRCGASSWKSKYGTAPDEQCDKPCAGEKTAVCGGKLRNTVFQVKAPSHEDGPSAPANGIQNTTKGVKSKGKLTAPPGHLPPTPPVVEKGKYGTDKEAPDDKFSTAAHKGTNNPTTLIIVLILVLSAAGIFGTAYLYYQKKVGNKVHAHPRGAGTAEEKAGLVDNDSDDEVNDW